MNNKNYVIQIVRNKVIDIHETDRKVDVKIKESWSYY